MWQHCYQRNYSKWFRALYSLNREVYHLSPWASRASFPSRRKGGAFISIRAPPESSEKSAATPGSDTDALLRLHSSKRFDPAKIAQLELHWWQLRRENSVRPSTVKSWPESRKNSMAWERTR